MALVACPECGQNISSEAASCPHCGHPLDPRRTKVDYVTGETFGIQPRPAARAARPLLRYPSPTAVWMMTGGSVAVILGSFMPWVRLGPISIPGIEGDGKITAVIGLVMVILGLAARSSPSRLPRISVLIGAILAVAIAVTDANGLIEGGLNRQLMGTGLGTMFIGGMVAFIGTFLRDR
ncbi:MAG: zinc ribbon domain-containing protein [Acidimicrobiia bacterium]